MTTQIKNTSPKKIMFLTHVLSIKSKLNLNNPEISSITINYNNIKLTIYPFIKIQPITKLFITMAKSSNQINAKTHKLKNNFTIFLIISISILLISNATTKKHISETTPPSKTN
jgi:hypothetical protein